jgi:L-alanine-DL-glutamate epimerase-like enolase superfamily enzyme
MTRRAFILSAAAAAAAEPEPPIRAIEVFPVAYPVSGHFRFFTRPERPAVFVKVTCEEGRVGWGQSVPISTWSYETTESVVSTIRNYLAPVLIGRSPLDIAGAHAAMNRAIAGSFSTGMPIAKAGIDLALHDLAGRAASKSVATLWNKTPLERIPLSWTVNPRTLDEAHSLIEEGKARGYEHFNIKVAPDPVFDIELARIVRKAAPKGFLWADANGGYDPDAALAVAPKLADAGVNVFEQPVAPNRLSALRDLRKQKALPVILDEGVVSLADLEEFHKLGLLDGVAMKPARTAGLWTARKQIEFLQRENLLFLGSGLTDPDVSLAASLALYGAYQLRYPAALNGPQFLRGSFLDSSFQVVNGALRVPTAPGLGVSMNEEEVRCASRG